MAQKGGSVSPVRLISALIALALCFLGGCVQRDIAGAVIDPNFEWVRDGFSVKAPPGLNWYRLPDSNSNRKSVAFQQAEALSSVDFRPLNTVYIKGETAFAASTILGPVKNRKDKNQLVFVLRKYLEQCLFSMKETLENSVYDTSLGSDCLKYGATSTIGRIPTDKGDMYISAIHGYFCLHPDVDNFGVIIQTSAFATVWTDIAQKEKQSAFFQGLRFLPVSNLASPLITKR